MLPTTRQEPRNYGAAPVRLRERAGTDLRMSETEHEPERRVEDLQARADSLRDRIDDVRGDWENKKADATVPGAEPDPGSMEAEDPEATAYPAKGGSDDLGGDVGQASADESLDARDPENEDL